MNLTETVVGLLVTVLLVGVAFDTMRASYRSYRRLSFELEHSSREALFEARLAAAARESTPLPGVQTVLVHDRSVLPQLAWLKQLLGTKKPMPGSDAVSFLQVARWGELRIRYREKKADETFAGCRYGSETAKHWFALWPDGYAVLEGTLRRAAKADCMTSGARLVPIGSFSISPFTFGEAAFPSAQAVRPGAFFAVTDSFTICLDDEGVLRRRSHFSAEHPPLEYGCSKFSIQEAAVSASSRSVSFELSCGNDTTPYRAVVFRPSTVAYGWLDLLL
ncbi:MAG: hypothetical protein KDD69_11065 [Bdellovibrionales bacterium]|nr:hypothetical protein [Bdellovibrionales bacterium]